MTIRGNLCAQDQAPKPPTRIHTNHREPSDWPHYLRSTTETCKRGENFKKQEVRKPALTNPVLPQGLCFISWWGFVTGYRLRYFNQWIISKTKCIKCQFVGLLFYSIKTLLAWILLRCASVDLYLDVVCWHSCFLAKPNCFGVCKKHQRCILNHATTYRHLKLFTKFQKFFSLNPDKWLSSKYYGRKGNVQLI